MTATITEQTEPRRFIAERGQGGMAHIYYKGETNHCPSCGRQQWWVGRDMATCAFCETHIPIVVRVDPAPLHAITTAETIFGEAA